VAEEEEAAFALWLMWPAAAHAEATSPRLRRDRLRMFSLLSLMMMSSVHTFVVGVPELFVELLPLMMMLEAGIKEVAGGKEGLQQSRQDVADAAAVRTAPNDLANPRG